MIFPEDYSTHMFERSMSGVLVENETIEGSAVKFEIDASSKNYIVTSF